MILKIYDNHNDSIIKEYDTKEGYTEDFIQQKAGYCSAQGFKYEILHDTDK